MSGRRILMLRRSVLPQRRQTLWQVSRRAAHQNIVMLEIWCAGLIALRRSIDSSAWCVAPHTPYGRFLPKLGPCFGTVPFFLADLPAARSPAREAVPARP